MVFRPGTSTAAGRPKSAGGSGGSGGPALAISPEMEEVVRRIQANPNVLGVMVVNSEGFPVKSNLDNTTTSHYGRLVVGLAERAKSIVRCPVLELHLKH